MNQISDPARPSPHSGGDIELSVGIPVYNEEAIILTLHNLVTDACRKVTSSYEILFVDDGSSDTTPALLAEIARDDPHVTVVTLSRNFGHAAALSAAVTHTAGRYCVLMDGDLQDDPSAIPLLVERQRETDADVVYVVRTTRDEPLLMRTFARLFHRFIAFASDYPLPQGAGSFGLVGPRALEEIRRFGERLRYFPGLRAFVGFKQVDLHVPRGRRYDNRSRVGARGLIRLAALAFFSQSRAPVKVFYILSGISLLTAIGLGTYAVVAKALGVAVIAWTSTITSVAFFSSMIILGEAFICEYLARIYEEVRRRPVFIVDSIRRAGVLRTGAEEDPARARPAI